MIDDNRGQMTGTLIPIVFIMAVGFGAIIMVEVLEQAGVDPETVVRDLGPEGWLAIGGVIAVQWALLVFVLNRSGYRPSGYRS